ncbi:hypothetical protein AGMMS49545_23490 [Betaproteobacteria bacterium]|nr:hypothetical protein AGMMS49545_23490 [Betaproteobacteria bacterium]GHU41443.1 hypothetical protein AGMMS50289_04610 [Betaproteobacteria bacterium]
MGGKAVAREIEIGFALVEINQPYAVAVEVKHQRVFGQGCVSPAASIPGAVSGCTTIAAGGAVVGFGVGFFRLAARVRHIVKGKRVIARQWGAGQQIVCGIVRNTFNRTSVTPQFCFTLLISYFYSNGRFTITDFYLYRTRFFAFILSLCFYFNTVIACCYRYCAIFAFMLYTYFYSFF